MIAAAARAQVACYPGGGTHYLPHRDSSLVRTATDTTSRHGPSTGIGDARVLTLILYANPGWKEGHGGELRLHSASRVPALLTNPRYVLPSSAPPPQQALRSPSTGPGR